MASPASAQSAATAPPDLSGTWGAAFVYALQDDPPFLPDARAKYKAIDSAADPLAECKPPGVPRITNMAFMFEIVQTPKIVYMLFEYDSLIRRIYIDGTHPADMDPSYLGHSIGHWEGKTLVVDTVGFNDVTWLDMRGHIHSEDMKVIERYTRSDDGKSLTLEVEIDDPKTYSKPFKAKPKVHQLRPDVQIAEFICEQG